MILALLYLLVLSYVVVMQAHRSLRKRESYAEFRQPSRNINATNFHIYPREAITTTQRYFWMSYYANNSCQNLSYSFQIATGAYAFLYPGGSPFQVLLKNIGNTNWKLLNVDYYSDTNLTTLTCDDYRFPHSVLFQNDQCTNQRTKYSVTNALTMQSGVNLVYYSDYSSCMSQSSSNIVAIETVKLRRCYNRAYNLLDVKFPSCSGGQLTAKLFTSTNGTCLEEQGYINWVNTCTAYYTTDVNKGLFWVEVGYVRIVCNS